MNERIQELAERTEKAEAALARVLEKVIGWRETDWPEGFDRRTAELIADSVRGVLAADKGADHE